MKERDIVINMERCSYNMNQETECPDVGDSYSFKVCGKPMSVDVVTNGDGLGKPAQDAVVASPDSGEKTRKERRLSTSSKKPPRPPRGLSLDAADQKLIKEISEFLVIKRAKIERMKAMKKAKAAKGMSASTSSSGNLIAMLLTILFCIGIIFQCNVLLRLLCSCFTCPVATLGGFFQETAQLLLESLFHQSPTEQQAVTLLAGIYLTVAFYWFLAQTLRRQMKKPAVDDCSGKYLGGETDNNV